MYITFSFVVVSDSFRSVARLPAEVRVGFYFRRAVSGFRVLMALELPCRAFRMDGVRHLPLKQSPDWLTGD